MKRCLIPMTLLCLLTSCAFENNTVDVPNNSNVIIESTLNYYNEKCEDKILLTEKELIELCSLSKNEYEGKNLTAFISDFELTAEEAGKLNIHALLENYTETYNVEYVFKNQTPQRQSDYTESIKAIAFFENRGTTPNSVYIDVENMRIWKNEGEDIFRDLNSFNYSTFSNTELEKILLKMQEMDIFTMESISEISEEISEPMSFSIAIEYLDGTCFTLTRTGKPSTVYPDKYNELRELLFS